MDDQRHRRHLAQDAATRRGDAGNNCATIVDGYTYHGAPAMATLGRKNMRGTVEDDLSALEERQANARRAHQPAGDSRYARDDRHADDASAPPRPSVRSNATSHGLNNTPMNTATAGSPRGDRQSRGAGAPPSTAPAARPAAPPWRRPPARRPRGARRAHVPVVDKHEQARQPVDQAIGACKVHRGHAGDAARRATIDQEIARQRNGRRPPKLRR